MTTITTDPNGFTAPLTRFDGIVVTVLLSLLTVTVLLIWQGDQVGATIISTSPPADAQDISALTSIDIFFGQPMDNNAVANPLTISPPVSGTVSWRGSTLSFVPTTALSPDTTYTIELSSDVRSRRGRRLTEPQVWQFTTRQPQVLYLSSDEQSLEQIYLYNQQTGESRALTDEQFGVYDYSLSPDGTRVAYAAPNSEFGRDLWTIDLTTGERYALLTCPDAACNGVSWHPDGQRLVYERRTKLVEGAAPGPPRLWWLIPTTEDTIAVFEDNQVLGYGATWSASGEWLSFVAPSSQGVQIYNVVDSRSVLIPSRTGAIPRWSPSGTTLLVSDIQAGDEGFAAHLFRVNPAEGELTPISGQGSRVEDGSPSWSPDGTQIAFTRKIAGTSMGKQLWLMNPDGSDARFITDQPDFHHAVPSWSPDGRTILVQRFALKEVGSLPSIWLIDVESGEMSELISVGSQPQWLP